MGSLGTAGGLSAGAKVGIAVASVAVVAAAGGIAFAATGGFGMLSDPPPSDSSAPGASASPDAEEIEASEQPEDAPASSMGKIFADGQSVECHYTVETFFEATATVKSMEVFRVDQMVNGGPAHLIQNEQFTLFWMEGLDEAEKFDTAEFKSSGFEPLYKNFIPAEFDAAMADDPDICIAVPKADDALFELPAGMTTTPGVPR